MQKWKMTLGTLAIGAVTISPFVAAAAFAGAEKKTVKGDKPPAPTASEVETGQLLIKDRPVAKSSTGGQPSEPTAAEVETGQLLIKDRPVAKSSTGGQPPEPTAAEVETGQLLIKDRPVSAAATGNDLCGLPYTPPCRSDASTAKKAADKVKPGLKGGSVILALLAGAGTIGALVAASGGDDGPTSP